MQNKTPKQVTAQQYAQEIASELQRVQQKCRASIGQINDTKGQAMFETIAEVLGGAIKALEDYQNRSEKVWQSQGTQPPVTTDMAVDISEVKPPHLFTE